MCGFIGFSGNLDNKEAILQKMMDRIVHRGPDMGGMYTDDGIALGFRRLSILDLSDAGAQPMANEENPAFEPLFRFYSLLARVLAGKCAWHEQAAQAVRRKDLALAARLAEALPGTIAATEALRTAWRALWEATNRPQGFEIIDLRLGGVAARLSTAAARMRAFAAGVCADIPELSAPALPYTLRPDGTLFGSYAVGEIVSACKLDI